MALSWYCAVSLCFICTFSHEKSAYPVINKDTVVVLYYSILTLKLPLIYFVKKNIPEITRRRKNILIIKYLVFMLRKIVPKDFQWRQLGKSLYHKNIMKLLSNAARNTFSFWNSFHCSSVLSQTYYCSM